METPLDWEKLLSKSRYRKNGDTDAIRKRPFRDFHLSKDYRVDHEKDFDRIVFSTPVRRLQDKTQVFPLDQHDSVRTRLTHSLEVANIGRTLAAQLVHELDLESISELNAARAVPALVTAISIAHDIGNPPFGHQGEAAIRLWVKEISQTFDISESDEADMNLLKDYLYFDGNPQGFRLLTRLQGVEEGGLNLTASTLRSSFKYPWRATSEMVKPDKPKFGYFKTEENLFEWSSVESGLKDDQRHPLASIMEASDDICYSILDVEDGIKKELVSTAHLILFLKENGSSTAANEWITAVADQYYEDVRWLNVEKVTGKHAEDILMQLLRSYFISLTVSVAVPSLKAAISEGRAFTSNPCLDHDECRDFLGLMKKYTKTFIYSHKTVEKVELQGHKIIPYLLGSFWNALERTENDRGSKLDSYVIKQISSNYYRVYEETKKTYPAWYARLQIVCDMVCGMTDSFAITIANEFKSLEVQSTR